MVNLLDIKEIKMVIQHEKTNKYLLKDEEQTWTDDLYEAEQYDVLEFRELCRNNQLKTLYLGEPATFVSIARTAKDKRGKAYHSLAIGYLKKLVEFNNKIYPSLDKDGAPMPYLFYVRGNYAIAVDFWGTSSPFYTELENLTM